MKRPVTIYILFIFALINGLQAVYHALNFAGVLPFRLFGGEYKFINDQFLWGGVILTGIMALIWFWVAKMTWRLERGAYTFLITIAGLHLFVLFITYLAQTGWQELGSTILTNIVVLVLCALPSTRKALVPSRGWGE